MSAAKASRGLGRGFDALIPKDFDSSILSDEDRIKKLFIHDLVAHPNQPRKYFDETSLIGLAGSIKRHGILQPLVVTPAENKKYTIIAGERRWRAAKLAGLKQVPAIIRTAKQLEQLEITLIENVQRVDLSPLEQAVSILHLHEQFSISYDEIAKRLGKAITTINNIVRLLQLPQAAQLALQKQQVTEGHARAILALKDEAKQVVLLELILKHSWSVRQAEQYVSAKKKGARNQNAVKKHMASTTPATQKLSTRLDAPVAIRRMAKGGKVEIAFKTDKDLERILKKLSD